MKNYTDIEQSKKLAKMLPIESADMWYSYYGNPKYNPTIAYEGEQWFLCQIRNSSHDIPCWSLSALLDILPKEIGDYRKYLYYDVGKYLCGYIGNGDVMFTLEETKADNPIDACYEMIIKLNEQNLI